MRFEGTRPSRADKDFTTYLFCLGPAEMALIMDLCNNAHRQIPKSVLELSPTRQRVKQIANTLAEVMAKHSVRGMKIRPEYRLR